ncbi:MAG: hypothetical protein H8E78_02225 [Proteobacteria bacterium]|nr:hypothetical protein [Pseudomonadota bacterium]
MKRAPGDRPGTGDGVGPAALGTRIRSVYDLAMNPTFREYLTVVSLIVFWVGIASSALAERNVVREENGITVEEESVEGRALPILIGTATMDASAEQIAAWVTAVHTYVDWQHSCEEARVLMQPDGSRLTYNRIASPWPVSDRDVVLRPSRENLDNGGIRLEFLSTEDANFDVPRGVVRMPRLIGSYVLTPRSEGGTHVVYTVDSDPGGSLPVWPLNLLLEDLPPLFLQKVTSKL